MSIDPNKTYSFAAAMIDFFGKRPDKPSAADFMAELRALTDEDKAEFRKGLESKGYKFV